MASPLSLLRKHQKVLLVVFGVTLMVLFLVGSFLPDMGRGPGGPAENPVVVTWSGGKMTRMDLDLLRYRHFQSINLQNALRERAFQQRGQNFMESFIPINEIGDRTSNVDRAMLDEEIFRRFILAKMAADQGIVISDSYLDNFLAQAAGGVTVSRNELEALNRSVNRGEIGYNALRRHLKLELAAQLMMQMSSSGIEMSMSPLEIAQRYTQANRRIDCEVIPVKISDFLTQVTGQPTDAELRTLFNEGQRDVPDPNGKKPGFKLPRRFVLQFLTADLNTFLTNEINKLTDKEVQEEYERRVEANDPLVFDNLFGSMPDFLFPGLNENDLPLPGEGQQTDDKQQDDGDGNGGKQSEQDQNHGDGEQSEQQGDGSDDQNSGQTDGDGTQDDEFFVALFQDDDAEQDSDAVEGKQDESQQGEAQQGDELGSEGAEQAEQGHGTDQAEQGDDVTPPQDDPIPPRRRVRPLVEVADALKRAMAFDVAQTAMENALVEAEGEMRMYDALIRDWEVQGRRGEKPVLPDFRELERKLNLTFQETELIDLYKLRDMEFARQHEDFVFHVAVRFNEGSEYQVFRFEPQGQGIKTLFWFKEKQEPKQRTFAEAKSDVVEFWRQQQAVELAQRRAQSIALQSMTEQKSFYEIDPALARSTGEFSYISWGFNNPLNVENPGEEFMEAAFGLKPGEATSAVNADRTIVYAIRMIADATAERGNLNEMLYNRMVEIQSVPQDLFLVSRNHRIETYRSWAQQVMDKYDVHWLDR